MTIVYFNIAAYGVATDGHTTFINASTCSLRYKPTQPAIIFDIPLPEGFDKDELKEDICANTVINN